MPRILDALAAPDACLTAQELAEAVGLPYRAACAQLAAAYRAGLIERAEQGCYCLSAAGRRAAAGGAEGGEIEPLDETRPRSGAGWHRNTSRQRLWAAMRMLGKFCRGDLIELAAAEGQDLAGLEQNARCYVRDLAAAGYLVPLPGRVKVKSRATLGQRRWRLVRDTGPQPPQVRRGKRVFDRNLGRVVGPGDAP